jgi:hypothetical protein
MLPDLAVTAVRRKCQTATREQSLGRPLGNRWRFPWTVLFQGVDEDFFPPPPSAREPESRPPSPEWMGPPYGVLPGAVALEVVLAENEQAAAYIGRCDAYPTGLDFELHVLAAASAGDLDPSLNGIYQRPGGGSTYEEMLRFGVAFADGRKGSNLAGFTRSGEEPEGPVLWGMGGGGGGGRWHQGFWMWPLPPIGPLFFVCEWPAAGIPLTRIEVDSKPLRDAAGRSRELFPNQASAVRGSTWSRGIASARARAPQNPDS